MRILINTMADDPHSDAVAAVLADRGHAVRMLRNLEFPETMRMSFTAGERLSLECETPGQRLEGLIEYDAVWNRRNYHPGMPDGVVEADRAFVRQELLAAKQGFWAVAGRDAFWINPEAAAHRAMHKPLQLSIASRVGLAVPETLIGNDPARVRRFVARHRDECIYKPFQSTDWKEGDRWMMAFTSLVREEDLPCDALLQACPGIYQRRVRKQAEVRATFMGESCLAVRIDSQATRHGTVDWRIAQSVEKMGCAPMTLPEPVKARCLAVMRALDIVFGCFDFIIDEDGEYVFLEVNEAGQFLFLEVWCPELPTLDMFCKFLIARDPAFRYRECADPVRYADVATASAVDDRAAP